MNWGYRIILLYTGFIGGLLYLIYRCTQENIDLVAPNYYEQEIKYQEKIDQMNNSHQSGYRLQVLYNEREKVIEVSYPSGLESKTVKGEITLFRPDNSKLDLSLPVQPVNGKQRIPAAKLNKGYWRVQSNWSVGDIPLYQEEKIFIQ
ncbi:MAG: FixH family protein [Bacteroidia bacterium]|nr:FixH family protein [Bacteroidia bacterium]